MIVHPNAKINLGLNVLSRRPDGYHNIETIFYPIPLQDTLEVTPLSAAGDADAQPTPPLRHRFRQSGDALDCAPEQNLVLRALQLLEAEFDLPPLDIHLQKFIPSGAGLGGGSSDAAFMMRLVNEEFHLGLNMLDIRDRLAPLGADCPFFAKNEPVFATGIGDQLTPIGLSLSGWTVMVVKPDIHVSTREAYAGVRPSRPTFSLMEIVRQPVTDWRYIMKNAFEASVFQQYPEIRYIKATMLEFGAAYASMSGSGSAVFGLFRRIPKEIEAEFEGYFIWQHAL